MDFLSWIELRSIDLVQSIGIIGGFFISWYQVRASNKIAKFQVFIQLGESHHAVWSPLIENQALNRIQQPNPDLIEQPITDQERAFLVNLFIHFEGAFEAERRGFYKLGIHEREDIADFLQLPIPRRVWDDIKGYQPVRFMRFIDSLLSEPKKQSKPFWKSMWYSVHEIFTKGESNAAQT